MLLDEYFAELNTSELHRRCFTLALGSLPSFFLSGRVADVLEKLIKCLEITPETEKWAEGRRDAVTAIMGIVKTVGVKKEQGKMGFVLVFMGTSLKTGTKDILTYVNTCLLYTSDAADE